MSNGAIQPEKLLRQFHELWLGRAKEPAGDDGGVLRACSMTLIAAIDGEQDIGLPELMREHPSRAILLRLVQGGGPRLEARVFEQCWKPFGRKQQICCEQVEIHVSSDRLPEVAPVVRALAAPDLEVVAYCRGGRFLDLPVLDELAALADKLIIDSANFGEGTVAASPAAATGVLGALCATIGRVKASGALAGDLAWTRLTRWREMVAQVFDDPANAARIPGIESVSVEWEGGRTPVGAYYVLAWLEQVLGRRLRYELVHGGPAPQPRIRCIRLQGGTLDVAVTVGQDRNAAISACGQQRHTVLPRLSEIELLHEELSILRRDPAFDRVVELLPSYVERR